MTTYTNNSLGKRTAYWVTTGLLSLCMLSGGLAQLFRVKTTVDGFIHLHYPPYLTSILGIWKVAGVVVLLTPRLPLVKEWAYAGFFFAMTGAVASHLFSGDSLVKALSPLVMALLTVASWYLRPASRRLQPAF
ncbi:MAG TPA: DoxX family protein [Chitinophaga sp.]